MSWPAQPECERVAAASQQRPVRCADGSSQMCECGPESFSAGPFPLLARSVADWHLRARGRSSSIQCLTSCTSACTHAHDAACQACIRNASWHAVLVISFWHCLLCPLRRCGSAQRGYRCLLLHLSSAGGSAWIKPGLGCQPGPTVWCNLGCRIAVFCQVLCKLASAAPPRLSGVQVPRHLLSQGWQLLG
jgi:hypothetical protein